jgi:hypothetical protein
MDVMQDPPHAIRVVVEANSSARDVSRVIYSIDTLYRIFVLTHGSSQSQTDSPEYFKHRKFPWNHVAGLDLARAETGSIEFFLLSTARSAVGPFLNWLRRNLDPVEHKRLSAQADIAELEAARLRNRNEAEAKIDGERVEQAQIATDRQRVDLFGAAIREIVIPLQDQGYAPEQAIAAASVATRSLKSLNSMSRSGTILEIDGAFDDL